MKTLTVNGIEMATVDVGSGTPVLLVHGYPLDHTMWDAQIDALSKQYRVIAPDLRGFGQSGLTEGTVTIEQFADDLAALLDALGVDEPIVFCGLSMGGYVAWQFWRKYASRVKALIVCDSRAIADTPEAAAGRRKMADRVLNEGPSPLVETMMPKLFSAATVKARPEMVEAARRVMMSTDPRAMAAAGRGMAGRPEATSILGQIDCPALILVGRLDAISTGDEMQSIAQAMPNARFVSIEGSGHMSPMEKPAEVNAAIIEFLGDRLTGSE